jgi:glutathione S-transferase
MTYELHVFDVSYFSGKMEAYLRYKQIPFSRHEPSWGQLAGPLYAKTGQMKLPVLKTPSGEWLRDTTPMIEWLEARHPTPAVIPHDPYLRFLSFLIEDYADEWMWRPALYYRWAFPLDAALNALRFTREFLYDVPAPRPLVALMAYERQARLFVRGDGVSRDTRAHVEGIYLSTLERLQRIFAVQPFLLGAQPTLADFGFFGSMFRHFSLDPTPSRIMRERAPAVYEWVARLWNARGSQLAPPADPPAASAAAGQLPAGWGPLLDDIGAAYLPYLHRNASAFAARERRFTLSIQGVTYRNLPTVQYRVYCRHELQRRFHELPAPSRAQVEATLSRHGCLEPLLRDGVIRSHYSEGYPPPYCRPRTPSAAERCLRTFTGIGWNAPGTFR